MKFINVWTSALLLLTVFVTSAQSTVQIGDITGNPFATANDPMYNSDNAPSDTHTQHVSIITAAEITTANGGMIYSGVIDRISLFKTSASSSAATGSLTIWMKSTASTMVSLNNQFAAEIAGLTPVFQQTAISLAGTINNWVHFDLDVPWTYNGTDNIMLLWQWQRDPGALLSGNTAWKMDTTTPAGDQARSWVGNSFPTTNDLPGDNRPVYLLRSGSTTFIAESTLPDFTMYPIPAPAGGYLQVSIEWHADALTGRWLDVSGREIGTIPQMNNSSFLFPTPTVPGTSLLELNDGLRYRRKPVIVQ